MNKIARTTRASTLRRLIPLIAIMGCTPCIAVGQVADEAPTLEGAAQIQARLARMVILLDDKSWDVRQQAMRIIGDPNEGFELDMLSPLLERGDLSHEARLRLMQASRSLFAKTTKAGLGVGFGAVRDGGVEIRTVVPNVDQFPAAAMLIPGDLIIGAEGEPLTTSEDLRAMILSHAPGEKLNLLVQRNMGGNEQPRVLDLALPLGSYQLLTGAAPINARIADRAIQLRWDRQGISLPRQNQIGTQISVEDWLAAGYPEEPGDFRPSNLRRSPMMVSSGSSREVFVGVGTVVRGRIEPWYNRSNAQVTIDQSRRIELSQQMNIARMQVQLFTGMIEQIESEILNGDQKVGSEQMLEKARTELLVAETKLNELTAEFEQIPATP